MLNQRAWIGAGKVTLVAFVWLFSTVRFQMCPQMAGIGSCIITLVAFVRLFSTVCFQMSPQSACIRGCIVTLVAFVRLFSTVHFQMSPQMACPWGCIVTLVAFVWLFSTVFFKFLCIYLNNSRSEGENLIFKMLLAFWNWLVLSFAQMVSSNWAKFRFDIWCLSVSHGILSLLAALVVVPCSVGISTTVRNLCMWTCAHEISHWWKA